MDTKSVKNRFARRFMRSSVPPEPRDCASPPQGRSAPLNMPTNAPPSTRTSECSTEYKQDCQFEWRGYGNDKVWAPIEGTCQNVPYDECKEVAKTHAKQVAYQECKDVPEQKCISVPRQVCVTVPDQQCHSEHKGSPSESAD